MNLLKRNCWPLWLIAIIFGSGAAHLILGALLDVYDENAWYTKWQNWILGLALFIFPFFIMITIFLIQILTQIAAKLNVSGKEIYLSPYTWILCMIVPIFGWIFMASLYIYLYIMVIVALAHGEGEQYI